MYCHPSLDFKLGYSHILLQVNDSFCTTGIATDKNQLFHNSFYQMAINGLLVVFDKTRLQKIFAFQWLYYALAVPYLKICLKSSRLFASLDTQVVNLRPASSNFFLKDNVELKFMSAFV